MFASVINKIRTLYKTGEKWTQKTPLWLAIILSVYPFFQFYKHGLNDIQYSFKDPEFSVIIETLFNQSIQASTAGVIKFKIHNQSPVTLNALKIQVHQKHQYENFLSDQTFNLESTDPNSLSEGKEFEYQAPQYAGIDTLVFKFQYLSDTLRILKIQYVPINIVLQ
ncbi:MAG: hypothetical protein HZB59_07500 [Ignavibacteriales bacterium]|nr:hypothetical protein [Ignavibacteriales bacterium]